MTTPAQLLDSLNAAPDDAARLALLNAASRRLREQLHSTMFYRRFMAESAAASAVAQAAFEAFSAELNRAPDDDTRLQIIAAAQGDPQRGAGWLAEWSWRSNATVEDWQRRYLATVSDGSSSAAPDL
jgi:hypothetical protein